MRKPAAAETDAPEAIAYGAAMLAINPKRRSFVMHYIANGNGAQAARAAGYAVGSADRTAYALLHDEGVLAAIAEEAPRYYRSLVAKAIRETERILDDPNARDLDKLRAADGVLARADPVMTAQRIDVRHSHSVAISHTDAALEALAYMMSLQVPEAKLVETFGVSGLPRYRRMLEERESKRVKVIEHDPAG